VNIENVERARYLFGAKIIRDAIAGEQIIDVCSDTA
jgi:hypothetical protein